MWPCCRTGWRVPPDRQRSIQRHDAAHRMTTQHDTDAPLRRSLRLAHNNALRQPRSHRIHRILQRATRGIRRVHLVLDAQARIRLQHKMRQPLRIPLKGRLSTPSKPACKHSAVRPTHARRQAAPCQGAVPPPPRRSRCPCREVEVTCSAARHYGPTSIPTQCPRSSEDRHGSQHEQPLFHSHHVPSSAEVCRRQWEISAFH